MTLKDFLKIAWRITNDIYGRNYWRPDAVCMSKRMFDDLANEAMNMVHYAKQDEITAEAQLCGLQIFVDDDMPDTYYQIGYKDQFIKYFEAKIKRQDQERMLARIKEGI